MKDRNLRKAFRNLVERLGGDVDERYYSVGGVYGIYQKDSETLKLLLNHLNLEVFEEGKSLRKKRKKK